MRRPIFYFLFFLSGVSGLIYQVTWVRQATLVFGVSIYAYSAVLTAFMGGAALGSFALRRYADRTLRPLRFYAWLQVGIAIFGVVTPLALTALMPFYGRLAQSLLFYPPLLIGLRALFSVLILVPPTVLMGATLPAMARVVAQKSGRVGSDVGKLYAVDTLGAAIGCGAAGLWLLPMLGVRETAALAASLNLTAAIIAFALSRRQVRAVALSGLMEDEVGRSTTGTQRRQKVAAPTVQERDRMRGSFVVWAYALSGFVALGYEVVWARILAIFTLNAVFSFAIMLTTFLVGLTVGGTIGSWWLRRRRASLLHFGYLQLAIAIAAIVTLYLLARLPSLTLEDTFGVGPVRHFMYFEFLVGFIVLFVPTTLLGVLFPFVVSIYTQERATALGEHVGVVNALNTAGAIAGSLAAGFILIPLLGLQWTVIVLAATNLCLGVYICWLRREEAPVWWVAPVVVAAAAALLVTLRPDGYYLGFREGPSEFLVFYEEGVETTVAVFDIPSENFKVSFVNGRIEVPTDEISMRAFRLLGHLPALLRPDAQSALMLSFGNGIATGSLDTHEIPVVEAVDLSAEQFAAAELYWKENHNILRSPRLHTYVEDGRNFLLQTPRRYDIITTDATHPTNTSSWALFTKEFYEQVANRLTPNGVFVQWMPFHSLSEEDFKKILRTFQSVFPHATLWYTGGTHTLLVATPSELTTKELSELLKVGANRSQVANDLGAPDQILGYWIFDEEKLRSFVGDGPLVRDNDAYFLPHTEDTPRLLATFRH